jgi:prepilin-type N-terminal cleavage/methylation domain-containing protein
VSRAARPRAERRAGDAGFTLVEMLVAMFLGTLVMGVTLSALNDALRANSAVIRLTSMNGSLRSAMDLMVRDFLQVGSGLPPGHVVDIPSGAGASLVRIPGPPGSEFTTEAGASDIAAVIPGDGQGAVINGIATDTITVLMADNTFTDVALTAVTATTVTVSNAVNINAGPDRVTKGQLMMITKGSYTTLVQVTAVNAVTRVLTFASGDSLNLNQPIAAEGNLAALNAAPPANTPANTKITRVRMISYYLDARVPDKPKLIRRINNGHETTFDNTLGTAVGLDIENLQISYDLADGNNNPADVKFSDDDLDGSGACAPQICAATQIRKINVSLTGRGNNTDRTGTLVFRNTLTSQVSLRGMAFLNEYQQPQP